MNERVAVAAESRAVTFTGVLRQSWSVYKRRFGRVALTAVVVFVPIGLIESVVHTWREHAHITKHGSLLLLVVVLTPVVGFLSMFGEVLYAGLLDETVGADIAGEPLPSIREIFHRLPIVWLFFADLLVSVMTQIGTEALVVPGMILFTLFAIVGPIVNVERKHPLEALKRSVELVWPHFWIAAGTVLVPTILLEFVGEVFVAASKEQPLVLVVIASAILSFTLAAGVGLIEVVLAHMLIAEERSR